MVMVQEILAPGKSLKNQIPSNLLNLDSFHGIECISVDFMPKIYFV